MGSISYACGLSPDEHTGPTLQGTLYGQSAEVAKLKKRILCASRRYGIVWQFTVVSDLLKAAERGIERLPALEVEGKLWIQGLAATEEIEKILASLVDANASETDTV